MKNDTDLAKTCERLKAEAQELARANTLLQKKLAEQERAMEALRDNASRLGSLAAVSADWYWEQDEQFRFVAFSVETAETMPSSVGQHNGIGKCRWELPGAVAVSMSWAQHRTILEAHLPFRDFEFTRLWDDGVRHCYSISGMPIFDGEKRFKGYRGSARDITEAKKQVEGEREAFQFLDAIVDSLPIAFHLKSAQDHRVLVWNRAAETLYGLAREETIGRTVHDFWPKADADVMHAADVELAALGVMQDFPDRAAVTKHRGPIRVHMRKVPLRDASGAVTHILITAEEITDRLAAEVRLRESEARFRGLTRLSSDWYWELDDQLRFISIAGGPSDELGSFAGADRIGSTRWEIDANPHNADLWAGHRAQLEAHRTFRDFEYEHLNPDGTVSVLCISGEPIFDAGGKFTGYRGVGSDITARKQTEVALKASEARFRTVVSSLAEGVILRDADGRIVDCNASAERIIGKSLAQMQGKSIIHDGWECLREDGTLLPESEYPSERARRTGQPQTNMVMCYRKPDGTSLWTLVNVQPLVDAVGKPVGFVSSLSDITNRKRAEMEIVRLNVDLENRVSRRTAQLEAANKELEAFSYSVAHDLRSPLSTIDGYCALLQKAVPADSGERAHHYLNRIRGGVHRMGELTNGLLSLAKLQRTSLNWEDVDLSLEAGKILRHLAEAEPGRTVRVEIEPELSVRGDGALLRQVLDNLLSNAWKFTSKKSAAVISVGRRMAAGQAQTYFVQDNGAGFDMAYVDKLFGTFQRLHSPEEFSGSGIGLATVDRIIHRHGGRIWAESAVEQGSTFYFTLGAEQGEAAADLDAASESGIALAQPPRSRHLFGGGPARADAVASRPISSDNDAYGVTDQQFSNAFEHAAIGMALVGMDSRRLRVNSAFCQMLGYSEAEMLSRTVQDITHPDDADWDIQQRQRALAGEIETYQWEKRYIHRDGHIVWGYLTCSLVRDADRKPLHFISQIQDITERKQTEKTLRESEERFRALTALSSDWFWEQDENLRYVKISGDVTLKAGMTAEATEGKLRWELPWLNKDDASWAAHRAQLERRESFRDFEMSRLDAQGGIQYLAVSGVPIFDSKGRFTGYRGTGRDTTQMHLVTEALRASESQLRQITDTVPALIAYVDRDQRFSFHNRAYEEAFGLSYEDMHGKTMREVMGDVFYEIVRPRVEEVLSGYPVVYERTQKTARGDLRDYVVNYFPRYGDADEDGEVIGFYSLASDITEFKRIDRMKSEFVSTVSHELRTPLTSIRGSLGLISGGVAGALPEGVKALVGIAKNNCERLIRLINDILDIEKIESGKMRLDFQVVPLQPLMSQVLAANEGYGVPTGVSLKLECPDDIQVNVDTDRLTQVITNLLSNAIKFSPQGGLVEVGVSRAGMGVRVEVRDHGPGIPAEFRNRIFQKFSQADSSDTRQKGGTGLGLNISRAIVERLGGSIGFDTVAGEGTVFFFELPEWKDIPIAVGRAPDEPARTRILVCEDDRDIARLISMMLDKAGFDSDLAHSAEEALTLAGAFTYAAMTVDLNLPGQDGIGLIRALRCRDNTANLPILVVSALAEEGKIECNNELLSVVDWLNKPIDQNQLVMGLRRAIASAAGGKMPRVLHVEDDLDIQRIAATIAQDFATFEFASTVQEARARLFEQHFDLILLDLGLPGGSGWDLLADIEALRRPPPVVVFSAEDVDRAQSARAKAVLIKGETSNAQLLETLQRVLQASLLPGG